MPLPLPTFLRTTLLTLALAPAGLRAQSLTLRGSVALQNTGLGVAATATTAYVFTASSPELRVYDVRNAGTPVLLSSTSFAALDNPGYNTLVVGSTLYASLLPESQTTGSPLTRLLAFDVSNPAAPKLQASVTLPGLFMALAAGPGGTLCVLPLPDPSPSHLPVAGQLQVRNSQLQLVGTTSLPSGGVQLSVTGQTAYVTYGSPARYRRVDLSTPSAPVAQTTDQEGSPSLVVGRLAFGLAQPDPYFGGNSSNSLRTYNVGNPAAPVLLSATSFAQVGRELQPAPSGVYTYSRVSPYYYFSAPGGGPLTAYLNAGTGAASVAVTASPAVNEIYAAASAGNRIYVTNSSLSIYELSTGLATRPPAAATLPLYPNPVRGTLHLPQLTPGTVVTLTDALGRCCLQAALPASGTLDLSALPAGLYLVRAGASTSKLVVE